jgi:tRNA threonylcarbamoyladenosine biosynthesis protein TsaE
LFIAEHALSVANESETAEFAAELVKAATLARPEKLWLHLQGDLGSGKTTFTRYLLRAMGVEGRIKSPSYALLETYDLAAHAPFAQAAHLDLYRFDTPAQWRERGLDELEEEPLWLIVEWAENAAGQISQPDLRLHLAGLGDARELKLAALTVRGASVIKALA